MINDTTIDFSIRIIGLNPNCIELFEKSDSSLHYTSHPYFKNKGLLSVSVELDQKTNLILISDILIKCAGEYLKADIFISLSSEIETQILELPYFVVSAIKYLPTEVSISYTVFSNF